MNQGSEVDPDATDDGPPPILITRRTVLIGTGALAAIGALGYWATEAPRADIGAWFATPLWIPPILGSELVDGERVFHLTAQAGTTELVPGVPFATMGFNGTYLGPTIRAARGEHVRVHVTNELATSTTAHWHGMILPATQDGTMHQMIEPAATWTATWQIDQPAATLWYHPHPHGQTERQVGRGMAGLFLIDGDASSELPSDYGIDDVPLIIQDVTVQSGGRAAGTPITAPIGRIGNTVIVNGTHQPHFRASTTLVRLRILNASAARCYNLELSTREPFHLVGTGGGLLPAPEQITSLLLSPAERAEVIVRVAQGADIVLRSNPHDLGMSQGDNITSGADDTLGILRITGSADAQSRELPRSLPSPVALERHDATATRSLSLGETTINGKTMDMGRIDTVATAGATEIWTVSNRSRRAHNLHIHGTQFAIDTVNGETPGPAAHGLRDTVFIAPGDTVELIVPFGDFADPGTPYMYHCHMLWHEDQGMMGQYVLTADV